MLILAVDDDVDSARMLSQLFKRSGWETVVLIDSMEVLPYLMQKKPEIMIIDVHMPQMDGITLLRAIRSHSEHRNILVLMPFSARSASDDSRQQVFRSRLS